MFLKRMFSVAVLLLLVSSVLLSAFNIQSVQSAPEAQTSGNNGQGNTCEDQISQYDSLSHVTSPRFSDRSVGEMLKSDKLEEDFKFGEICLNQYLLYRAWRVFDPCRLPKEYLLSSEEAQLYRKSGTIVIQEIKENWKNLDPETQSELEFVFKRPTDSGGGLDDKKHLLPKLYNTTNFVIHWTNGADGGASADAVPLNDGNANGVPDFIENFAAIFEDVRNFEVGIRGFHAPPNDSALSDDANRRNPDQRYDVFIYNMSVYGYANPELYPNSPSYSFIGVDNDYLGFSTSGLQAMQVTAAHEFFHAIQYYYDCTEENWWKEATSTYMEDEVYPDVNNNYLYLPYWFQNCDSWDLRLFNGLHEYGDFIFAKRLSEDFSDNIIREIWEEMRTTNGTVAIDNALIRRGSSFVDEFRWFTIANFFLEDTYVDGADYRKNLTGKTAFNGVWLEYEYDAAFKSDYIVIDERNVNSETWMDRWATNYITIKLDPTTANYRIFFDGLDPTTNYLTTIAFKKNGTILRASGFPDAQKDTYWDLPYDPTIENWTLIISNTGNTATEDPSWRVIITKLLPQMELYYDDGTNEENWWWTKPGGRFAVRFTPSISGRLIECSFYIGINPATVKVYVMDQYMNNDLITPFLKTPRSIGWLRVDLSKFQVAVSQGVDFYIAIESTVANAPGLGTDTNDPDGRSWNYNGVQWSQSADKDYMIRATVATETPETELYYDDGTDEKGWYWPGPECMFAVRFTPTTSGQLTQCSFYIRSNPAPVKVHVMDKYRENDLITPFLRIPRSIGWLRVDLSKFQVAVSQGVDFYIAIETTVSKAPALGADTSDPDGRSWDYDGQTWTPFPSEDYMIRAIIATERPDLTISDISWSPSIPVEGDTVTFTVNIQNRGPVNAGAFKVSYHIDGSKIGEWSISSLSAGQNVNKSFTWTAVQGNHTVKAFADSSYNVEEQVEINNMREEAFQVIPKPKPDLIVSNISWSPLSPSEGDTVTFTIIIKNNNTLNASSFKTSYYVDGAKLGEWSISSLPTGQTTSQNFTWTAIKGNHTVEAFADSSYNIDEIDENNNRRQGNFSASGKPDLIISDISWAPSSPKESETVNFTVYIQNQGTETASSFMVAYYVDGTKLGEWSISSLSAGQNITRTFNWPAVYGTHTVKAFADSSYNISEKDENNNQKEKTFSVSGKPDLIVSDISWSPANPVGDDTVTFTVTVGNQGNASAGSFKVVYYIDGVSKGEWSISSLPAGQNITKSFTWTAVQDNHTVKAFADSSYNIDEKVEINNEREETFKVVPKPKPELIISDIFWVPETPVNGATVTFTVTIKNNGTASAGSFKTAYYVDQTKLGEWSITSLSVGQEVNKTFTWTYVEGSHVVKAIADSNGEIQEDDETNNEREEIIGNLPPVASFSCNGCNYLSNPIAYVRKSTTFNATESYDPDGSIASYSWDFGDGNVTTVTDPVITHNYTLIGNYTTTLNVTDDRGMWHTATANVTVKLKCDLNGDGVVNVLDVTIISKAYNSRPGDPKWNPDFDFDKDGRIGILDVLAVCKEYGARA